jgi:hypothetical protein
MADEFSQFEKTQNSATGSDEFAAFTKPSSDEFAAFTKKETPIEKGGWIDTTPTTDAEIAGIARKHGVDPTWLKGTAPLLGAKTAEGGAKELGERALAFGSSALAELPTKAYISFIEKDPKKQAALQDLRELADQKKSVGQKLGEGAAAFIGAGKVAKGFGLATEALGGFASAAAEGALVGGAEAVGKSAPGEASLGGAASGALTGGLENVAFHGITKGAGAALRELRSGTESATKGLEAEAAEALPLPERLNTVVQKDLEANAGKISKDLRKELEDANIDPDKIKEGTFDNLDDTRWEGFQKAKQLEEVSVPRQYDSTIKRFIAGLANIFGEARTVAQRLGEEVGGKVASASAVDALSKGSFDKSRALAQQSEILSTIDSEMRNYANKFFDGDIDKAVYNLKGIKHGDIPIESSQKEALTSIDEAWNALRANQNALMNTSRGTEGVDYFKKLLATDSRGDNPLYTMRETVAEAPTIARRMDDKLVDAFGTQEAADNFRVNGIIPKEIADPAVYKELEDTGRWLVAVKDPDLKVEDVSAKQAWQALGDVFDTRKVKEASFAVNDSVNKFASGNIPNVLLETNPSKQVLNHANSALNKIFMEQPFAQVEGVVKQFKAIGRKDSAEYMENLLKDVRGGRVDTEATALSNWAGQHRLDFQRMAGVAEREGSPIKQKTYEMLAELPGFFHYLSSQAYPNFLGMSPRATLMHMTHMISFTIPEMAKNPKQYAELLAGVTKDVIQDLITHRQLPKAAAVERGLSKTEMPTELKRLMYSEVTKANAFLRLPRELNDKATNFAMAAFEFGDATNRLIASKLAERAAREPAKYAHILPTEYRVLIKGLDPQDPTQLARISQIFRTQIGGSLVFNYDRATVSAFARSLGPAFSMFTKWPTAVAGKLANAYLEQGAYGASKYTARAFMAPFAMLYASQKLIDSMSGMDENSTTRQYLFSKEGLIHAAPITSLGSMVGGDMFSPPAIAEPVKAVSGVYKAATGENGDGIGATLGAASDLYHSFGPGGWILRMVNRDMPKLLLDKKDILKEDILNQK